MALLMYRPVVEAQVEIDAPIDVVWSVMLDVARYGEWNPFIVRVAGAPPVLAVGDWFDLHVRWSDGSGVVSREGITRLEAPAPAPRAAATRTALLEYRFGGFLDAAGLVRGARQQTLSQAPGGPTRYHTREEFRGLLTRFVPLARVRDGFERHARALKTRAESLAG